MLHERILNGLSREEKKKGKKKERTSSHFENRERVFVCWKRYRKILFRFATDLKRRFGAKIIGINYCDLFSADVSSSSL
jgi:hypothetical protein